MDHISANLAFGRREKNIWGYKKLQGGGKKPIRKTGKKWRPFFLPFFLETVKKFWGRQKNQQGAPNGNVTPLMKTTYFLLALEKWRLFGRVQCNLQHGY